MEHGAHDEFTAGLSEDEDEDEDEEDEDEGAEMEFGMEDEDAAVVEDVDGGEESAVLVVHPAVLPMGPAVTLRWTTGVT